MFRAFPVWSGKLYFFGALALLLIVVMANWRYASVFSFQEPEAKKDSMRVGSYLQIFTYHRDKAWQRSESCTDIQSNENQPDFVRVYVSTPAGKMTVYLHNPETDYISSVVYKRKTAFEPPIQTLIFKFLRAGSDINFIDIGANIGLHALLALKAGRKVIALEAVKENVEHICASVDALNMHRNIRIFENAVGANHEYSMFHFGKKGRFGTNFVEVKESNNVETKKRANGKVYQEKPTPLPTIMLDDLLTFPDQTFIRNFYTNFIKLDVEGSESKVLEGAKKFLKETKCVGVLMEWRWHRKQKSADVIQDVFKSLNYEPFNPFARTQDYKKDELTLKELRSVFIKKLNYKNKDEWPHDILWMPVNLE